MLRNMVATIAVIIGAMVALATIHPAPTATPISGSIQRVGHHTDTLPSCSREDGSGQALCMWDAQRQGNGMGTSVVAGACSLGTVHTEDASAACMRLWGMDVRITYGEDGSISETAKGSVLVADCLDIEWQATMDNEMRNELNNDGWNLFECFDAHIVQ